MKALDLSRLVNVKTTPNGWQCQCPACFSLDNRDKTGRNHLHIYRSGAFHCVVNDSKAHNKAIRAYLLGGEASGEGYDYEFVPESPKLTVETVYPESMLSKLVKDYSYWIKRGAKPEVIERLEGGLAPEDEKSKLSGRFIFPVRNMNNQIIGFSGRLAKDNSYAPKWKHVFPSSKVAYSWKVSGDAIKRSKKVVLSESIGDQIALLGAGIDNTLCIFGLNLNSVIIGALVKNDVKDIVISLNKDSDPRKGQAAAQKIKDRLDNFFDPDKVIIRLPNTAKDWGEASVEELELFKKEIGV